MLLNLIAWLRIEPLSKGIDILAHSIGVYYFIQNAVFIKLPL